MILNLPLITLAMIAVVVDYKMKKISRKKLVFQICFWILILAGLSSASFIYQFLFSNNLTKTEPLSLFDVIQITGIITLLFITNRSRIKSERMERRLNDLHQELSIVLSKNSER